MVSLRHTDSFCSGANSPTHAPHSTTNNTTNNTTNSTDNSNKSVFAVSDAFNNNVVTSQTLDGSVSNISVSAAGPDTGEVKSGDIHMDGSQMQGFSGINTMTQNTGIGSLGQAATAVGANSNITFGH